MRGLIQNGNQSDLTHMEYEILAIYGFLTVIISDKKNREEIMEEDLVKRN